MRQRLLLPVVLVIVVAGGCATTGPAWPEGYREAICTATAHLRAAEDASADAISGVAAAESERVAIAAAGIERESNAARAALDLAPGWSAGAPLSAELGRAAVAFAKAALDFNIGARQGDGPALDRAIALARDAEAALARADHEGNRLRSARGWPPC